MQDFIKLQFVGPEKNKWYIKFCQFLTAAKVVRAEFKHFITIINHHRDYKNVYKSFLKKGFTCIPLLLYASPLRVGEFTRFPMFENLLQHATLAWGFAIKYSQMTTELPPLFMTWVNTNNTALASHSETYTTLRSSQLYARVDLPLYKRKWVNRNNTAVAPSS